MKFLIERSQIVQMHLDDTIDQIFSQNLTILMIVTVSVLLVCIVSEAYQLFQSNTQMHSVLQSYVYLRDRCLTFEVSKLEDL